MGERLIVIGILLIILGQVGACVTPGAKGAIKELHCTMVFQTGQSYLREDGSVLVEQHEIKGLNCYQVWAWPKERE